MIRSVLVLSWETADFTSWKASLARLLNVLGIYFMECNIAIRPVSIQRMQEHLQLVGPFPLGCEAVRILLSL